MHSLDLCRKVPTHNAILKVSDGLFTSKDPITDTDYRNLSHLFDQLQSAFSLITRFMSEESELNEDRAELEGIPGDSLKSSIVKSIADYTNYGASIGPSPTSSSYKSRKGLADAFNTFSENASLSAAKNLQFMLANSVRVFELTYDQLNAVDRALGGSAGG